MFEQFEKLNSSLNTNLKQILESVKGLKERVNNKEFQSENVKFLIF